MPGYLTSYVRALCGVATLGGLHARGLRAGLSQITQAY